MILSGLLVWRLRIEGLDDHRAFDEHREILIAAAVECCLLGLKAHAASNWEVGYKNGRPRFETISRLGNNKHVVAVPSMRSMPVG